MRKAMQRSDKLCGLDKFELPLPRERIVRKKMRNTIDEKSIAIEKLKAFIKQKKMRQTAERILILSKIYDYNTFFDVQTLHEQINKEIHISLATIYNTLELLQECRLIIRHNFSSQNVKYEKLPTGTSTYYKICTNCDKVKAFSDGKLTKSIALRNTSAFSIVHHTLYLYGICKKCREKMERKKR